MKIHIVQKGDTLWKIAKKYGVNFEELKKMNSQLSNPDMIMPGMKIKVPTSSGTVKKEGAVNIGVKKEVPIAEQPIAKEIPVPIKEVPKKEVPIVKEKPIIKEAPKAPYTPKMPLQIVPEIDINNYYMTNMSNMTVQPNLPPKPTNILPEVKEVPKKEIPKEAPKEVKKEMPILAPLPVQEVPIQENCVPVTPVMPGPGFCPPYGGYPMQPSIMPYQQAPFATYAPSPEMIHGMPGVAPTAAGMPVMPGATYTSAGPTVMPGQYYHDESSSFMPQLPVMNPAYQPGPAMGTQPSYMDPAAYSQIQGSYGEMPGSYGQVPASYGQVPASYGQMPGSYGQMPGGYGQMPGSYGQMPGGYDQMPGSYAQMPAGYQTGMPGATYGAPMMRNQYEQGQSPYNPIPYGYPQMSGPVPAGMGEAYFDGYEMAAHPAAAQMPVVPGYQTQGIPVGAGGDCGCGPGPSVGMIPTAESVPNVMPTNFVPPTPPIYSAPYSGPVNVAQPPYMNPYGMGPVGASSYGMPGYRDESD